MRTLSRPMFRMGGPIKEGVMHGIREPYRGGQLVQPGPGRPGYAGKATIAKGIFSKVGKLLGGDRGWWSKIRPTGKFRQTPGKEISPGFIKGDFTKPGQYVPGPKKTAWEIAKSPSLAWKGIKENPWWAGGAAVYGGPAAGELGYNLAKGPGWSLVKQAADLAVPDWLYDQDKHLAEIAARKKEGEKEEPIVTPYLESKGTKTELTAAQKEKWADAQRGKRLNNLLDIMGYDASKKTAVADALIDASKIVSDRGTLEAKNITRDLINPIIQATSKRFDKPDQIREAVGLMATKAEIEKDISKEKDALAKQLTMKQIKLADQKLEEGFETDIRNLLLTARTPPNKKQLEQYARLTADKYGEPFTQVTEETDLSTLDNGIYMSEDKIIRVTDGVPKRIV